MAPTSIMVNPRGARRSALHPANGIAATRASVALGVGLAAVLALVAATTLRASAASAAEVAIAVDGDLKDVTGLAEALRASAPGDAFAEDDATGDVRVYDPGIVAARPISEHYFANGFDQTFDVFAYDRTSRTLYLGLRVAGAIGDADGDDNPDASSAQATIGDEHGIGARDRYFWSVRGTGSGGSAGRIVIEVTNNQVSVHGATPLESAFAFRGSELEVVVRGIDLPQEFEAKVAVGSGGDGLGEDTHALGAGPEPAVAVPPAELLGDVETPVRANGGAPASTGASGAGTVEASAIATVDPAGATATDASVQDGLVAAGAAGDGIAVLGRPYPNPFGSSVTFGFEVKSAGQTVDVGVYDVTGRLVTKLASGPRDPGRASVRWDGRDDGGVLMAPGVYFLKASIGGVQKVQRLVRVDG